MKRNHWLNALLGGAFLIAFACTGLAQDAAPVASTSASDAASGNHAGSRGDYLLKLAAVLGLSDAQVAQIKAIFQATAGQFKAIQEDSLLAQDQKLAQINALRDNVDQKISAVLTPGQQQKFASLLQRFQQRRVERR